MYTYCSSPPPRLPTPSSIFVRGGPEVQLPCRAQLHHAILLSDGTYLFIVYFQMGLTPSGLCLLDQKSEPWLLLRWDRLP